MEFFDKISKVASETYKEATDLAKEAGKKTSKMTQEAKIKIKIKENKNKIEEIYKEIGEKVYQKHVADEKLCIKEDLQCECKKIDELSSEISSYHEELKSLSNESETENTSNTECSEDSSAKIEENNNDNE